MTKNLYWKKEKWTNKGYDKHEDADSSLTRYNKSYKMFIRNFKILSEVALAKSLTKYFIGEKEKWTNKGNDKHEDADSFLHKTGDCTQYLYQISKS